MPRTRSFRPFLCAAVTALLAALGCVDHQDTNGNLYVFDNNTKQVRVWSDLGKVYEAATTAGGTVPAAERTITSDLFQSSWNLGWGGLTLDTTRNRLYLVAENGTVTVITKANTLNGTYNLSGDTFTFTLGSGEKLTNGVFGQASLDSGSDTLFVMESALDGTNGCRIWKVPRASQIVPDFNNPPNYPVSGNTTSVANDQYGAGLASVLGGNVVGLFGSGNSITDVNSNTYTGGRLRMSVGAGALLNPGYVLIGGNTGFGSSITYGGVGYDNQNSLAFVFGNASTPRVLVFTRSQLVSTNYNQAPDGGHALGTTGANLSSLRTITHAAASDWLLGANYITAPSSSSSGTGTGQLLIWKEPSKAGANAIAVTMPGNAGMEIRGMAVGQ